MGFIYKITNKNNNLVYIGQTTKTTDYRFKQHIREAKSEFKLRKNTSYFHNTLNKYGANNFLVETIEEVDNTELNERELYWILYYNANQRDCGYNLSLSGNHGSHSKETKEKIGAKTRLRWKNDPNAARRMRDGLRKATMIWKQQAKRKRVIKQCLLCGGEFEVAQWNKDRKYCGDSCRLRDISRWINYQPGLDAATKANKCKGLERANQINTIVLEWTKKNRALVLNIPLNNIKNNLTELLQKIEKEIGVVDARTISKAVCKKQGLKPMLLYLQNYVKMYAVPDQN